MLSYVGNLTSKPPFEQRNLNKKSTLLLVSILHLSTFAMAGCKVISKLVLHYPTSRMRTWIKTRCNAPHITRVSYLANQQLPSPPSYWQMTSYWWSNLKVSISFLWKSLRKLSKRFQKRHKSIMPFTFVRSNSSNEGGHPLLLFYTSSGCSNVGYCPPPDKSLSRG